MSELGPGERRLIAALRSADEPSDQDRERVRGSVLAKLAVGSGIATTATTAQATTAAAAAGNSSGALALLAAHWKAALTVALVGTTGAVGTWWIAQSPATSAVDPAAVEAPRAQPPPSAHQPSSTVADHPSERQNKAPSLPAPEVDTPGSAARKPKAARTQPINNGASLDQEVRLLGRAQHAMKQGDAKRALQLLEQHAAEHPSGVLSQERAGVRAVALCRAGQLSQGRAAAKRFLAQSPDSPLAARIRAACFAQDD